MDRHAFILGMVAAFCECVAADAKPLALSPPLTEEDLAAVGAQVRDLIARHGLLAYHERNLDRPAPRRHWLIIYARPTNLDAYLQLREKGLNPQTDLDAFADVLGYGPGRIHTGYDAFHALFDVDAPPA